MCLFTVLRTIVPCYFTKEHWLNDANNLLIQQTENVQSARQIRFKNKQEIIDIKELVKTYIFEAVVVLY